MFFGEERVKFLGIYIFACATLALSNSAFATATCGGGGEGSGGKPSACTYSPGTGGTQVSCIDPITEEPDCGGPAPCEPEGYNGTSMTITYEHAVPQADGSLTVADEPVCPPDEGPDPE